MKKKSNIGLIIMYVVLIVVALMTLVPIVYTFLASFKSNAEIMTQMGKFFPSNPTLDNYKRALESSNFYLPTLLWNSIVYTVVSTVISVVFVSMAGYSFEKGQFPLKNVIFACFTFLMFVKIGSVSIYATFEIYDFLHLPRNLYTLLLLHMFSIPIVSIYLVRGYVKSIPNSIIEAAQIDGCSFFRTFIQIVLPIIKPIIVTVAILQVKASWNDYINPTVFTLSKPNQRTLIVGLMALKSSSGAATSWDLMLAGSVISMIPIFLAYIFLNKYFVQGLSAGAEKG